MKIFLYRKNFIKNIHNPMFYLHQERFFFSPQFWKRKNIFFVSLQFLKPSSHRKFLWCTWYVFNVSFSMDAVWARAAGSVLRSVLSLVINHLHQALLTQVWQFGTQQFIQAVLFDSDASQALNTKEFSHKIQL